MVRIRQLKSHHSLEAVTKKVVSFFGRKNRVTPSVAAPGDTNPSDATGTRISWTVVFVLITKVTTASHYVVLKPRLRRMQRSYQALDRAGI